MEPEGRVRGGRPRVGRYSERRDAWVALNGWEYVITVNEPDEDNPFGQCWLAIRRPGQKRTFNIPLHNLTGLEIHAFQEIMEHAFRRAMPFCEAYDTEAEEARKEGDDSFARLYRPVPRVVVRERR